MFLKHKLSASTAQMSWGQGLSIVINEFFFQVLSYYWQPDARLRNSHILKKYIVGVEKIYVDT